MQLVGVVENRSWFSCLYFKIRRRRNSDIYFADLSFQNMVSLVYMATIRTSVLHWINT